MVEVIDDLNKRQCEVITNIILERGKRKYFHRGLLPFVPIHEVMGAITAKIHVLGFKPHDHSNRKQIKYLKSVLNKLMLKSPVQLYEDEASATLFLQDAELYHEFGQRFSDKFFISQSGWDKPVRLVRVGKNKWKVTAEAKILDKATTWLADYFR